MSSGQSMYDMPMDELSSLRYVDDEPGTRGEATRIFEARSKKLHRLRVSTLFVDRIASALALIPEASEVQTFPATGAVHFNFDGDPEAFKMFLANEAAAARERARLLGRLEGIGGELQIHRLPKEK